MESRTNTKEKRKINPNSLANLKRGGSTGRKPIPPEVRKMFEGACPEAVQLLIETMHDDNAKLDLRLDCANQILDRGIGKAIQQTINENINNNISNETNEETKERLLQLLEELR